MLSSNMYLVIILKNENILVFAYTLVLGFLPLQKSCQRPSYIQSKTIRVHSGNVI